MRVTAHQKKWLSGTLVGGTVCCLALALHWSGWLTIAELKTLDHLFQRYADSTKASQDIVLVAVDEASLEAYGRWPWSRDRHGYVVRYLKQAGAKAVVFDILFFEPDRAAEEFDDVFAEEMRAAGNVYLPFLLDERQERPAGSTLAPHGPEELSPDMLEKATIRLDTQETQPAGMLRTYPSAKFPISLFARAAHGLGYINLTPDIDGTTRRLPLLAGTGDQTFLHLATAVARDLLATDRATLRRRELQLGRTRDGRRLARHAGESGLSRLSHRRGAPCADRSAGRQNAAPGSCAVSGQDRLRRHDRRRDL
jgi:adenylate cyclase